MSIEQQRSPLGIPITITDRPQIECGECYMPATWTHTHGCGKVIFACDKHRLRIDRRNSPRTPGYLTCVGCGHYADQPIPWRPL